MQVKCLIRYEASSAEVDAHDQRRTLAARPMELLWLITMSAQQSCIVSILLLGEGVLDA
jgi:hypothetical protein